jgi:MarR family transcriptional regulator for hemolysin
MDELYENFAVGVHRTAHQWRICLDRRLRPLGLSQSTWRVLLILQHACEPQSQNAIAEALGVDGASVVRLIDKLEADGLVKRGFSPQDRRVRLITLTEGGLEKIAPLRAEARQLTRELLSGLDEQELAVASKLLTGVLGRLDNLT